MTRLAAVDVGSNTVHVLVADAVNRRLEDVAHYVEMPRLGAEVARTGRIGEDKAEEALAALDSVLRRAAAHGYQDLVAGATEAVRRAADRDEFLRRASERSGVPVRLISGELEARLSFRGAASRHAARGRWLMVDAGGASTEVVAATGRRLERWATLSIGSGALASPLADPPAEGELDGLRRKVRAELAAAPDWQARRLVATGGSASNLARVVSPERRRRVLSRADLERARSKLGGGTARDISSGAGLPESRVVALRAGVEILLELLLRYRLDRLHVSVEGLRHGMLLAYLEHGSDWFRRS